MKTLACAICKEHFPESELYYTEGDCPTEDCPGIDEDISEWEENFLPEDVFDNKVLTEWAEDYGFVQSQVKDEEE